MSDDKINIEDERRVASISGVESGPDSRPPIWGIPEAPAGAPPQGMHTGQMGETVTEIGAPDLAQQDTWEALLQEMDRLRKQNQELHQENLTLSAQASKPQGG